MNVYVLHVSSSKDSKFLVAGVFSSPELAEFYAMQWTEAVGGQKKGMQFQHKNGVSGDNLAAKIDHYTLDDLKWFNTWIQGLIREDQS